MNRVQKSIYIALIGTLLFACKLFFPAPTVTPTTVPSRTFSPTSPPTAPAIPTQMPAPVERLAFTVATNVGGMYSDTIIAFANNDGTSLEFPSLFEPFRDTGGVSGKHLVWSPDGQWIAFIRFTPGQKICTTLPSSGSFDECDNGSLYLIRPDGSDLRLLLEPIHLEVPVDGRHRPYNAPNWSPDSEFLIANVPGRGYSLVYTTLRIIEVDLKNRETSRPKS